MWDESGGVLFEVADDGCGFDAPEPRGIGLLNIEDRVGAHGGTLTIESGPGRGTKIHGAIPTLTATA